MAHRSARSTRGSAARFVVRPLVAALAAAGVIGGSGVRAATIVVSDGGDSGTASTCTLRQAVVDSFNAKKARTFLQKQVHHISTNRELADGIKFLFDEHGRPPNMPIEDSVEERRMVEYHLMWVEGVLNELRHRLIKIKEVEDYAFEMLARAAEKNK